MPSGELWLMQHSSKAYQFSIDNSSPVSYASLSLLMQTANGLGLNLGVLLARMRLNMNCTWEQKWTL